MKLQLIIPSFFLLSISALIAQSKPFPQNVTYPNGFKPVTVTSALAQQKYNDWKSTSLVNCGNFCFPSVESAGESKVTAVGYGMLIAAYEGDKTTFDKLHGFYNSKRRAIAKNMMAWRVTCDSTINQDNMTEGDIDVAFSLLVAHKQWGETYLTDALAIINILQNNFIDNYCAVLYPGYNGKAWGGCSCTSISYHTPSFFRIFALVTNDNRWNQLADGTYSILFKGANATTGLVPDWQTSQGYVASGMSYKYGYDACRTPWRIALDYLWNGNTSAQTWCTKITNWARKVGTSNIKDGYELNGTATGTYNTSAFVGALAVGAMCNNQAVADTFGIRITQLNESYWYHRILQIVYLHVLTGNFWKPDFTTGVEGREIRPGVRIYPNPANGNNQLTVDRADNYELLEIITIAGTKVGEERINKRNAISIATSTLKGGIYLIKLTGNSGRTEFLKYIK